MAFEHCSEACQMEHGLQCCQADQKCRSKETCLFQSFGHVQYLQKNAGF